MAAAQLTELLHRTARGDKQAEADLFGQVYQELHRIAGAYFRHERPDHTLQATALVNLAYLRLTGETDVDWQNRTHFFAFAARLMRRILVDHARQRRSEKRGGGGPLLQLDENLLVSDQQCEQFPELDAALERLEAVRPRWARVVELRYFGGLTEEEIAQTLELNVRTVKRDWERARAWLHDELSR
jgi:RNA polymerase sigma-70 factor (ECF subfamily)